MSGPNDPMEWFQLDQAIINRHSNQREQEQTREASSRGTGAGSNPEALWRSIRSHYLSIGWLVSSR